MNKRIWDEKKFDRLVDEVGVGYYRILEPDDLMLDVVFSTIPESFQTRFTCACISTSVSAVTASVDFVCEGATLAKGAPVFVWRTFRYCEHDKSPHLNADDNIFFPDSWGNIWKVSRTDSPDHYIQVATWAGLDVITSAYHLPLASYGPYNQYVENGASVPIRIECQERPAEY